MRVALTTGLLRIPPTYFVTQHAERLIEAGRYEAQVFARASDVRDTSLEVDVISAVPEQLAPWQVRQVLALGGAARQRRSITAYRPDLIHQHFATWASGALAAGQHDDVPVLVTLHGYDVFAAQSRSLSPLAMLHRASVRRVQREAHRVLAVSDFLRDEALAGGFPRDRLFRHYQGVDTEFFVPAARRGGNEAPMVLFVGGLERRKGILDLLRASVDLRTAGHDHRLMIVGAGTEAERVHAAVAQNAHMSMTGSLNRDAVRAAMQDADVFVLPTQRDGAWREAAGLVLLEAQACGTPVVTYRSGGAPEMVRDGESGIVVTEGGVDDLADAVRTIMTASDSERARWRSQARHWVVSERSLTRSIEELSEHYDAVWRR